MDKKKTLLYVQAALCILWAALMAAAAVHIYSDGLAYRAQGHPEAWIYTREKAAAAIGRYLPLLLLAAVTNIACVVTGAQDKAQDRPVSDPVLADMYKKERGQEPGTAAGSADPKKLRLARAALFVIAAVFIAAGIMNGSMEDVFIKAVNICSECIGLG